MLALLSLTVDVCYVSLVVVNSCVCECECVFVCQCTWSTFTGDSQFQREIDLCPRQSSKATGKKQNGIKQRPFNTIAFIWHEYIQYIVLWYTATVTSPTSIELQRRIGTSLPSRSVYLVVWWKVYALYKSLQLFIYRGDSLFFVRTCRGNRMPCAKISMTKIQLKHKSTQKIGPKQARKWHTAHIKRVTFTQLCAST